jgi:hypothetical protein
MWAQGAIITTINTAETLLTRAAALHAAWIWDMQHQRLLLLVAVLLPQVQAQRVQRHLQRGLRLHLQVPRG